MTKPLMLAVSPPCIEPVNRTVYRILAQQGIQVRLVIPKRNHLGTQWKECAPVDGEPFPVTLLEPDGAHPRLQRLVGLDALIHEVRPTHLLVDNDPATRMTVSAARTARRLGAGRPQVWALTAENLPPTYAHDVWTGLRTLRPTRVAGAGITWWLRRTACGLLDRVFTFSRDGTRVLSELGYAGRVTQIPLGFDPELFRPQPPERVTATRAKLGLNQPTVAYFGRLTPEKGVHVLLAALALMKDAPWQLLVDRFADYATPYVAELQAKIAAAGLSDRVVFFDAAHSQMPDYMNAADVVVLPSVSTPKWKEQYGRVVPEAMACGKVVVGANTGAIPELIGNCGHIFPEADEAALATRLRQLLSAPPAERAALGRRAEARAHGELSAVRQAAIWVSLFLPAAPALEGTFK